MLLSRWPFLFKHPKVSLHLKVQFHHAVQWHLRAALRQLRLIFIKANLSSSLELWEQMSTILFHFLNLLNYSYRMSKTAMLWYHLQMTPSSSFGQQSLHFLCSFSTDSWKHFSRWLFSPSVVFSLVVLPFRVTPHFHNLELLLCLSFFQGTISIVQGKARFFFFFLNYGLILSIHLSQKLKDYHLFLS